MTLIVLFLSFIVRYTQSAIASTPGYLQELVVRETSTDSSNSRSLWTIVSGCFATILACTWISVHSNIPAPTDGALEVLGRRLAIMLNLLIAPEFVITWTARQYIASREIYRRHKARGWTKTHAFFVIMGGFSLYENRKLVRTLDIFELEKLEAEGKIDWPDITEEEIKDKSKGDYFSKGVVVLQTCWFIIQVIARGVEHMVVTELEVATLAFSALTMIIYFLWWNKPLDVGVSVAVHVKDGFSLDEEPSSNISHEHLQTTAAETDAPGSTDQAENSQTHGNEEDSPSLPIFTSEDEPLVSSPQDIEVQPLIDESGTNSSLIPQRPNFTPEDEPVMSSPQDIEAQPLTHESRTSSPSPPAPQRPNLTPEAEPLVSSDQDIEMQLLTHEPRTNSPLMSVSQRNRASISLSAKSSSKEIPLANAKTDPKRNLFLQMLDDFFELFKKHNFIIATILSIIGIIMGIIFLVFYLIWKPLREFVVALTRMLTCAKLNKKNPTRVPTFYCPKSENESIVYCITIVVGIVFGSIHCIAWSFPFPSFTELWLWRITSIIVAAAPVAIIAIMGLASLILSGDEAEEESTSDKGMDIGAWFTLIGMLFVLLSISVVVLAYIGARLCLLFLPLYALRALPEGAYDDVDWTIFLPHIHV